MALTNVDELTFTAGQVPIPDPPADAISALRFSPNPNSTRFAVASWDKHAYIYEVADAKSINQIAKFEHRAPVLDVCFGKDDTEIYTACLDWDVRRCVGLLKNKRTGGRLTLSAGLM
jgi:cell cycle arrest protein BUB3